ncbi:MAG: hypothetical protein R3D26_11540 [Cyanobacteriota/Melainabacteria group bacterium]
MKKSDFSEGLARFITKQGGRYCWGYYDANGRMALRPIYSAVLLIFITEEPGEASTLEKCFAIIDRQGKAELKASFKSYYIMTTLA